MQQATQKLKAFFSSKTCPIGLAVSGGADSMALLYLCSSLYNNLIVLHVNHQTREDSIDEEYFVQEHCQKLNIKCEVYRAKDLALDMPSFENAAREQRYSFFIESAKKYNLEYILTAHHQDDVIENVFLKFLRASMNIFIPQYRFLDDTQKTTLFRPFLSTKRKDLEYFITQKGVDYKTDSSNFDKTYLRNFLRLDILPKLKEKIPNLDQKIISLVEQRQKEEDFLSSYTKKQIEYIFSQHEGDVNLFLQEHVVIQERIIQYYLNSFIKKNLSKKHIQDILLKINRDSSKPYVLWENYNLIFIKEKNKLGIIYKNTQKPLEKNEIIVHNKQVYTKSESYSIKNDLNKGILYTLDDDIFLRQIHESEKIEWYGGSKSITKLLKEKNISRSQYFMVKAIIKNNSIIGVAYKDWIYIVPKERSSNHQDGLILNYLK